MTRRLVSSGSRFEKEIGYSRAVVDGDWVFVSGTTGFDYSKMEIPEGLIADVSEMDIGDTLPLTAVVPPEGVEFTAEDLEEVTIATLSPPRVEEEPEVEEEVLVGEDGEPIEPEEGAEGEEGEGAEGEGEGEGEAPAEGGEPASDDEGS